MRIDKIVDAPREFIFEKIVDSCLFDIKKIQENGLKSEVLMAMNIIKALVKIKEEPLKLPS